MKQIEIKTAYAKTGARNLWVSPVALGIARFGGFENEAKNHAQLDRFCASGGSLIDTALVYGRWHDGTQQSYSEKIFGSWLQKDGSRDRVVIATKGAHPLPGTTAMRVHASDIRSDITESLDHLKTASVDIYFLHRDDESVPVSEIMDELNRACERGQVHLLGASNWRAARIYAANDYCEKHGLRGFDLSQICFNIIRTTPEQIGDTTLVSMTDADAAIYKDLGTTIMAFTSQAGGFVSKFYNTPDAEIRSPYACAETFARMRRIRSVCEAEGLTPTAVTLGYLRGQALPVIPVTSASNDAQLDDVMAWADFKLSKELISFIDGGTWGKS